MTVSKRIVAGITLALGALVVIAVSLVAGCGRSQGFKDPGPPVGEPLLPDVVAQPPKDIQMFHKGKRWQLAFSSTLVNIGEGDFILRAKRGSNGAWLVDQVIAHSERGAEVVRTPAKLVWGGDGHDHWHVKRVAVNRLVAVGGKGERLSRKNFVDSKIGFCYYDHHKQVPTLGPQESHYVSRSCGRITDDYIGMGLSPGWEDLYPFSLPGQTIDVTNLPDGRYRLRVTVDDQRWFHELTHENNATWTDIELSTQRGERFAGVVAQGPDLTRER